MKIKLFVLIATIGLVSCGTSKQQGISGTIKGAEGETVYLMSFVNSKAVATDSSLIAADGSFSIQPQTSMDLNFYQLLIDQERAMVLITDSTESITLQGTSEDFGETVKVQGSPHTEKLLAFYDEMRPIVEKTQNLREITNSKAISQEEKSQAFSQLIDISNEKKEKCLAFIDANTSSPASLAALSELSIKTELDTYKKVETGLKNSFGHSFYYKMVSQQIENAEKTAKLPAQEKQVKKELFSAGMTAPDIVMNDLDGKERKLSDLRGKVVLIDFWASWCGPCRRENPNVVREYDKYHDAGFEIFSVSLDKDAGKWAKAVEQDGLDWDNHVSDLAGWKNAAAAAYGVSSIPYTVLVGRDGKIIGTKLRGGALAQKLDQLFAD